MKYTNHKIVHLELQSNNWLKMHGYKLRRKDTNLQYKRSSYLTQDIWDRFYR